MGMAELSNAENVPSPGSRLLSHSESRKKDKNKLINRLTISLQFSIKSTKILHMGGWVGLYKKQDNSLLTPCPVV